MGTCQYCAKEASTVSEAIGYCADCIRTHFEKIWPEIKQVHRHSRKAYGLPEDPPVSFTISKVTDIEIVLTYTYNGDDIRLISARRATSKERKHYEERI